MKNQLTILQNFIIINEDVLNHLKSDVGLKTTANVLGECEWIVNYKTELYLEEIKTLYDKHLSNYTLYNNLEDENFKWATTTLSMLKQVKTSYIFYLTEDRMFYKTTRKEFSDMMDEVGKNDIGFVQIGKLHKYSLSRYPDRVQHYNQHNHHPWGPIPPYMDNDKYIYTFLAKNCPFGVLSIDAIFRKDVLEKSLERLVGGTDFKSKENTPHILELGKHRSNLGREWNWLVTGMPDMLCAIPKEEIVISDDDPGHSKFLKGMENA